MLFFFAKKRVKKFLSNGQNFFTKICFEKSHEACASLIEKHNVDKKSKHLKKNIIFQIF
jgi:23S rRNA maturation-related 3'-5' exoribonuclease YhaM